MHHLVVGAQYGDEGKGKITDLLSDSGTTCVRFGGGANAAHTVVRNGTKFVFQLLPSGAARTDTLVIGPGVLVDPEILIEEIDRWESIRKEVSIVVDSRASLVMPFHKERDALHEIWRGKRPLSSTQLGVGFCASSRVDRMDIRLGDLATISSDELRAIFELNVRQLQMYSAQPPKFEWGNFESWIGRIGERLCKYMSDTRSLLRSEIKDGKVVFEGTQGTLLDLNFGTSPNTVGYSTIAPSMNVSLGVPNFEISTIGVVLAYSTRLGNGPFPTEERSEVGNALLKVGNEYSSEGWARRCGWLDIPALRYSDELNGFDQLALMKLDVLDEFEEIPVCMSYKLGGTEVFTMGHAIDNLNEAEPNYVQLPGWRTSTKEARTYDELPLAARKFIEFIEAAVEKKVGIISVGADAEETIFR